MLEGDPPAPNRNALWARTLVGELVDLGVAHACVGSGSRSSPLVDALSREARITVHPYVDERSAAYFALGAGAATGRPALVVTTSGTAAANLLPAMVEAANGEIPLIALTADRPASLRGTDANQTILQQGLFGRYPRFDADIGLPDPARAEGLRRVGRAAWEAALGPRRGPVHLNLQFEKPLEPMQVPGDLKAEPGFVESPLPEMEPSTSRQEAIPGSIQEDELVRLFMEARRPVLVCGPSQLPRWGEAALNIAARRGIPVLADPLSGARFGAGARSVTIGFADLILRSEKIAGLTPDLVLRCGRSPTSLAVGAWLERHASAPQVVVAPAGGLVPHLDTTPRFCHADPGDVFDRLSRVAEGAGGTAADVDWLGRWRKLDDIIAKAVRCELEGSWSEASVASMIPRLMSEDGAWFIGNSMPIRDVDMFAGTRNRALRTIGLRGASGIDGNISAALGVATASRKPTVAILGDLTVLHNIGALFDRRLIEHSLHILLIQNRGGGIFHSLPIRDYDPPFTPYIVMPHSVDFGAVAEAAGIPHRAVRSNEELREQLLTGFGRPGIRISEVQMDREENWAQRSRLIASVTLLVEEVASGGSHH